MRILFITDKLIMGGAETYFYKLENLLSEEEIHFFTAAGDGELIQKLKNKKNFTLLTKNRHLKNILILASIVKKQQINILHANSLRMVFYAVCIKLFISRNMKVVYTKHNVTLLERKFKRLLPTIINAFVDKVITVSEFEKKNLINLGVKAKKIETIHNGVDLKQFSFLNKRESSEEFNIGILGRLSEEKNHELFIQIAKELKNEPGLKFHIAGDGPRYQAIARMIKDNGVSQTVTMLGQVNQPDQFIKDMDILILTSFREVFPMVLLEAMAVGTPVISINYGGICEAIDDNKNGYLINEYSAKAFAEKIILIRSDDNKRTSLSMNGRKKVENYFTSEIMSANTLEQYNLEKG
ncbi:glycosyltransferase family 4 protein [Pseudalkalibacillus hwajinpoensis]|uniref:glycosyltransferase family 4 protein n=1 Tax=Guptibacillus hwajinpoensis TaxID=208199 RepID=UPI001CD4CB42|nr:glycosyltransferase family 4 protein [Pseudalkalibacillus hwajinpoensis]MCA0991439.1 glycosyltransferase family 4 protein [Pseudalkalibacillus hwajinpoensis]